MIPRPLTTASAPASLGRSKTYTTQHPAPYPETPSYTMTSTRAESQLGPSSTSFHARDRDEWEDWTDDEIASTIPEEHDQPLIAITPANPSRQNRKSRMSWKGTSLRTSSQQKPLRLKSRARQKAQNERAGIKVITDMTTLRRHPHVAHQMKSSPRRQPKFVDAAALKALEGSPNSASVGTWNWLRPGASKRNPKSPAKSPIEQDLSPNDRPIVIGISMDTQSLQEHPISPETATIETPYDISSYFAPSPPVPTINTKTFGSPLSPSQQRSVWSPDTPSTATTIESARAASSIYSQVSGQGFSYNPHDAPPVPSVPSPYQTPREIANDNGHPGDSSQRLEASSPCFTLFEEDGISPLKTFGTKSPSSNTLVSRETHPEPAPSQTSRAPQYPEEPRIVQRDQEQQRWDGLVGEAPGIEVPLEQRPERQRESVGLSTEWWNDVDKKEQGEPSPRPSPRLARQRSPPAPALRAPTPRRTPSPIGLGAATISSSRRETPTQEETHRGKGQILSDDERRPTESPPPYSPPQRHLTGSLAQGSTRPVVNYRAIYPPDHPLQAQYPPSPGPLSPGIAGTMSSQGAIVMTDIPLTPSTTRPPDRPVGRHVPRETFIPADGYRFRVERERQRHEKEEVLARRAGGFWRGRGCIPANGCFGRPGREGRKRRRIWLLAILVLVVVIVVSVVLGVRLSRKSNPAEEQVSSIFVNLTNFPPMPTGVLTVTGPDAITSFDGCTEPATLWSCSLPKEQQELVAPYNPDQPTIVMQIHWDNSTSQRWNVPNGTPPRPTSATGTSTSSSPSSSKTSIAVSSRSDRDSLGLAAYAASMLHARQAGFSPDPEPPSFEEMWFLGNTTDGIVSDQKAGEPTPFYISLLSSVDKPVGPNVITRRQISNGTLPGLNLAPPELNSDGTAAPAKLLPTAIHQPVRLYDRGLPTEHYAFYTYFRRTIFLRSVEPLAKPDATSDVPLDGDGGARETEARFLVTWAETRFRVQIWTNRLDTAALLNSGSTPGVTSAQGTADAVALTRPGTMPYPVTARLDTHGGNPANKFVWKWNINSRQQILTDTTQLLRNDLSAGGAAINPRKDNNPSFGGFDGGVGGCRCEWVNFIEKRPSST